MHACSSALCHHNAHPSLNLQESQLLLSTEPRILNRHQTSSALTMELHLIMLIAWLILLCRALGSTIPSLPAGAVLLERASQLRPVYDYVIVGGGTSGLVVANRLTEDPKSTCVPSSVVGSFVGLTFIHSLTRQVSM